MIKIFMHLYLYFIFFSGFSFAAEVVNTDHKLSRPLISTKALKLFDASRNRVVPVEYYVGTKFKDKTHNLPVVIINHGYTVKNTEYSSLAKALAVQGYFVLSIQHDLKTDLTPAQRGTLYERRKPAWDRGVANILFVIRSLSKLNSGLNIKKVTLIGHSNGGDMVMLFTREHPELVQKAISLDSLRMPFPSSVKVPILSLRANDTEADPGVLPSAGIKNITIIHLENAKHIDLCDRGPESIRRKINRIILDFLKKGKLLSFGDQFYNSQCFL